MDGFEYGSARNGENGVTDEMSNRNFSFLAIAGYARMQLYWLF